MPLQLHSQKCRRGWHRAGHPPKPPSPLSSNWWTIPLRSGRCPPAGPAWSQAPAAEPGPMDMSPYCPEKSKRLKSRVHGRATKAGDEELPTSPQDTYSATQSQRPSLKSLRQESMTADFTPTSHVITCYAMGKSHKGISVPTTCQACLPDLHFGHFGTSTGNACSCQAPGRELSILPDKSTNQPTFSNLPCGSSGR